MLTILRMPEVLANVTEVVLAKWTVELGAAVAAGDVLAEIETEKALIDLEAEQAGVVWRVLVGPGDSVVVGSPIAVLGDAATSVAEIEAALASVGASPVVSSSADVDLRHSTPAVSEDSLPVLVTSEPDDVVPTHDRPFASPISRRLAREGGVDLGSLAGSGPGGRIVRRDVERALQAQPVSASPDVAVTERGSSSSGPSLGYVATPHTPMRRAIARRLTESTSTVPHFYLSADCLVDELVALREKINAASSTRVSMNDLVIKAAALAFARVPEANVTWSEHETRRWDHVDIGMAVATDGGLVTPVIRGVEELSVVQVATVTAALVARARARTLRQEELEGGSFSVTNLGMFGTTEFSAIINPPQSAILAVGAAQASPVVRDGQLAVGTVMRCTLSVDHRAIDGALAARWLAAFQHHVEAPVSILL